MKVGDLVRCPADNYYWWSGRLGLVVKTPDDSQTWVRLLIDGNSFTKFGADFLELISESR